MFAATATAPTDPTTPKANSPLSTWLTYLEAQHPKGAAGIELGLERVRVVSQQLRQSSQVPLITVGGTNGKGSTCAMLEHILECAGYRVGLYTSPHLLDFNERIRIHGAAASDAEICAAFSRVENARHAAGKIPLTYFEFATLAAWECFSSAHVDVIILEVGLGGRLDAVNIYDADCAIISSIDLDHCDYLGHTREAIGLEKAGIFRSGRAAICGDPQPPQSLLDHAQTTGNTLQLIGRDFGYLSQEHQWQFWYKDQNPANGGTLKRRSGLAFPGLRGMRQLLNASCVLAALESLHGRLPIAMQDIRRGLLEVELPGRFQALPGRPSVILDVAHNPQAAQVLAENLETQLGQAFYPRTWAVFGILHDKDIAAVISAVAPRITHWLPCTLDAPRGTNAQELHSLLLKQGIAASAIPASFDSPTAALRYAREKASEDDRILVFGSFLTVAEILRQQAHKPP